MARANNEVVAERKRTLHFGGFRFEAALRESCDGAVRGMHVQRCGRNTFWMEFEEESEGFDKYEMTFVAVTEKEFEESDERGE